MRGNFVSTGLVLLTTLSLLPVACTDPATAPPREAHSLPSGLPANSPPPKPSDLATVVLRDVPFVQQKPDFCGEACVEMGARRLGKTYDQDGVFAATELDPALGRGAYTKELAGALEHLGFTPGAVWYEIDAHDPSPGLAAGFAAIHADLQRGVPTIVCMHYDESPNTTEHFRLIVGYDNATDEVVYQEPAAQDGAYRRMSRDRLFSLWPLKYQADRWTLVRLSLAPDNLVEPPRESTAFTSAAYAQHVMKLKERLDDARVKGLHVRIDDPFVVLGNADPKKLEDQASTVRWAVEHLEKDFFDARPTKLLDVFLFNDAASYEAGVTALTGEAPTTPYGFYSPSNRGLFMNIATGGGTLVHEIVHPYVEADFPDAPAWLNEGLGSLFEQSGERDGHIVGRTNWRLAGLQRAIKGGTVPEFEALTAMTDHEFYDEDRGTNYAQARYLFYYMQEKDLLRPFYKQFRRDRLKDPTGFKTLKKALGEEDMTAFKKRWESYVLGLTFP